MHNYRKYELVLNGTNSAGPAITGFSPEQTFIGRIAGMPTNQSKTALNFHSKCKILGGVTEFFGKAFLCRFPPENLPRPVVYSVHSLPIQVTLGDS